MCLSENPTPELQGRLFLFLSSEESLEDRTSFYTEWKNIKAFIYTVPTIFCV